MILKTEVLGSTHPPSPMGELPSGITVLKIEAGIGSFIVKNSDKSAHLPQLSKKILRACSRGEMKMWKVTLINDRMSYKF